MRSSHVLQSMNSLVSARPGMLAGRIDHPDCRWKVLKRPVLCFRSWGLSLALLLTLVVGGSPVWGEVTPVPDHAASRLEGWTLRDFQDGVLRFDVTEAKEARLVLKSGDPLQVEGVTGGGAKLRPGWDGTIGYSHYRLDLVADQPGEVVVRLKTTLPPDRPRRSSAADHARFVARFRQRASRPPEGAGEISDWQAVQRQKLRETLMGGADPEPVPLEARVTETRELARMTLRRVEYRTQRDRKNTLLLSLPQGLRPGQKVPLLLALHGHEAAWGQADDKAYEPGHADDFIAYFAERGWGVLQPATMNHTLQHAGWTLQGEWTWDARVALDYALGLEEIDAGKVAVCGLSTGAHLAMSVLALDERVRGGVVGCILSSWNHCATRCRLPPHCDCGILSQMGGVMEQCDWAALAAPKRVLFQHGLRDASYCPGADEALLDLQWNTAIMPREEYDELFSEVQRVWRALDRPDAVRTIFHDGPHKVENESAFRWLSEAFDLPLEPDRK